MTLFFEFSLRTSAQGFLRMLLSKAAPPGQYDFFMESLSIHVQSLLGLAGKYPFSSYKTVRHEPVHRAELVIFRSVVKKNRLIETQILFEKKENQVKKPSIFFKKYYNTKTSKPNRIFF